ncbi:MAG: hypothetical protein CL670_06520 [Balneola sp.]|jgi:uncharacterized protein YndB with AHSA1/START domain|nr:hypothetical protein [Balneola sp.]MAL18911.1 hypothetical protein [Balneola sp.]MBE78792.1 hypothetical protein [Balneola sp.]|tara:strand:+ start:20449 stop:20886 length:438 start_codon:yes stop_codon:yes gene_type:complete
MKAKSFDIFHFLVIKKDKKEVFDAITKPEHLNNWWPLKSSGEPKVGSEYNFYFGEEYDWYAEVIESVTNTSFHVRMTKSDKDWNPTSFGFELNDAEDGTEVTFQHTGWPSCNTHFKTASYCWAILLKNLKEYVEHDTIVPFEARS